VLGAVCAVSGVAHAQSAAGPVPQPADGSVSYKGITLYGIVDVGLGYENHGAPFSDYFMASSADLIQKNGNHSAFGVTSNNLSQSRIGLQGIESWASATGLAFFERRLLQPVVGRSL
jgi:hypothetical protein